jgi:hypothetical protein
MEPMIECARRTDTYLESKEDNSKCIYFLRRKILCIFSFIVSLSIIAIFIIVLFNIKEVSSSFVNFYNYMKKNDLISNNNQTLISNKIETTF